MNMIHNGGNPESIVEKLTFMTKLWVNRISMGVKFQ